MTKEASTKPILPTVRILKAGSCPTVTAKSTLGYHIGCTPESVIQFSVISNSAPGRFNRDWVPLSRILEIFDKIPSDEPITSFVLSPIFRGKSSNSAPFLMAVLKNEGLVRPSKLKQRCYERLDPKPFIASVKALIASKVSLVPFVAPVAVKSKAVDGKTATVQVTEKPKVADTKPPAAPELKPATASKSVIRGKQFNATKTTVSQASGRK